MKRTSLILAIAVVVVADGIALIGVARNRAGEPLQTIELTERELPLYARDQDNSGIDLGLSWTWQGAWQTWRDPSNLKAALDRAQLEAAGFDLQVPPEMPGRNIALLPRVAFVVLEYEGRAWEEEQKQQNQAAAQRPADAEKLSRELLGRSHLFVVDASRSMSDLRSRYPDQSRQLIVRAVLRARLNEVTDPQTKAVTSRKWEGHVAQILPFSVHVPLPHSRLISSLKPQAGQEPRYTVTLNYGRSLEPWVASIRLLNQQEQK